MDFLTAYDTGEGFFDRYIIRFNNGSEYSMSVNADSPQGMCYYMGLYLYSEPDNGLEVLFDDLPDGVKRQIRNLEKEYEYYGK